MISPLLKKLEESRQVIIDLKITPKSQTNQVIECYTQLDGRVALKLKIKGVPEKGKVNQEIINYLAKVLKLPKSNLQLISGLTSRNKLLQINH